MGSSFVSDSGLVDVSADVKGRSIVASNCQVAALSLENIQIPLEESENPCAPGTGTASKNSKALIFQLKKKYWDKLKDAIKMRKTYQEKAIALRSKKIGNN